MKKFATLCTAAALLCFSSLAIAQTNVANLAALRASTADGTTEYVVQGTVVVVSNENGVQPTRNQFLIVDNSGTDGKTGVFIDDSANNITETAAIGDEITNLRGTLTVYSGLLEFVPVASGGYTYSAGTGSSSPLLDPTVVTGSENWEDIEGEVIRLNGVDVAETGTWTANTTYALLTPVGPVNRIRFQGSSTSGAIGQTIPASTFNVIGEARQFNTDYQVAPRFAADVIDLSTGVEDWNLY